jgi:Domain of unknown function (DUF4167)
MQMMGPRLLVKRSVAWGHAAAGFVRDGQNRGSEFRLSNNRSSNRRRGRGGNRPQGGGNQLNRIDSRARGNAPQLLEKYRKLAHDASLNGDRVQAEYYLQFADHYFRVLADSRAQRDEMRPRRDDRDLQDDYGDDYDSDGERGQRRDRGGRDQRDRYDADEGERGSEAGDSDDYEASENPFTREDRGQREERGNREERAPREDRGRSRRPRRDDEPGRDDADNGGFDASILPPAIGKGDDEEDEKPRKPRRNRSRGRDDEESLETVE